MRCPRGPRQSLPKENPTCGKASRWPPSRSRSWLRGLRRRSRSARGRHRVEPPGAPAHRGGSVRDLTDVYAFRSPDRPNTVTIIANVIPGEDPAAGPNWYTFSPNARYNLKIDTRATSTRTSSTASSSERNTGPYFLGDTAQPFTVTRSRAARPSSRAGRRLRRTSGHVRRRAIAPRDEDDCLVRRWRFEGVRRGAAIRSTATSARSSTSSRSARGPATTVAARTSSPVTACTRSACRSRSPVCSEGHHHWRLLDGRPPEGDDPRRTVTAARGCRSTGSATRWSTR